MKDSNLRCSITTVFCGISGVLYALYGNIHAAIAYLLCLLLLFIIHYENKIIILQDRLISIQAKRWLFK